MDDDQLEAAEIEAVQDMFAENDMAVFSAVVQALFDGGATADQLEAVKADYDIYVRVFEQVNKELGRRSNFLEVEARIPDNLFIKAMRAYKDIILKPLTPEEKEQVHAEERYELKDRVRRKLEGTEVM